MNALYRSLLLWEIIQEFLSLKSPILVPIRRNYVLLGLSFSLDPAIQADTPNKQYCDFSRAFSVAFETDRDMSI